MSLRIIPWLVVVSVVGSLLVPSLARAQGTPTGNATVTLTRAAETLERYDATSANLIIKPQTLKPGVNLQDCRDDQRIRFPLAVANYSNSDSFEVWATDGSADCTAQTARSSTTIQCYRVCDGCFARSLQQVVDIPVKTLIKGLTTTGATDETGCTIRNTFTTTVFFLVLRGSDTSGSVKVPIQVDTQGPRPLSNVRAKPGDTRIEVSWEPIGEGGTDDIIGVEAYCDPNPSAAATDAGTTEVCEAGQKDPDAEAGATPEPNCTQVPNASAAPGTLPSKESIGPDGVGCSSPSFAPVGGKNIVPSRDFNAKYGCGGLSSVTGSSVTVDTVAGQPLTNGSIYAVAVAGTDSYGNVGELSSPMCQWPEPTSDFWRDYRNSGGQSGGGFCSIEGPGVPLGSFGVMAIGIVFGLSTLRRLRRVGTSRTPTGRTNR